MLNARESEELIVEYEPMDERLSRSLSLAGMPSESRPSAAAPAAVDRLMCTESPTVHSEKYTHSVISVYPVQ